MRPETRLDWIAFTLLIVGAFSWGYFVTDVNILDLVLERIWDPLDDVVFVLIGASGVYWLVRAFTSRRTHSPQAEIAELVGVQTVGVSV